MSKRTKSTKLLVRHKDNLCGIANRIYEHPGMDKLKTAQAAADKVVIAAVVKRYPPKDMAVLKKYDQVVTDSCLQVTGEGLYTYYNLLDTANAPLVPRRGGCSSRAYALDAAAARKVAQAEELKESYDTEKRLALQEITGAIRGCDTYEQVEEIFEWAADYRLDVVGKSNAITILSSDKITELQKMTFKAREAA